jgi:hypothetical protein
LDKNPVLLSIVFFPEQKLVKSLKIAEKLVVPGIIQAPLLPSSPFTSPVL